MSIFLLGESVYLRTMKVKKNLWISLLSTLRFKSDCKLSGMNLHTDVVILLFLSYFYNSLSSFQCMPWHWQLCQLWQLYQISRLQMGQQITGSKWNLQTGTHMNFSILKQILHSSVQLEFNKTVTSTVPMLMEYTITSWHQQIWNNSQIVYFLSQ